jgi:hypothetical protein
MFDAAITARAGRAGLACLAAFALVILSVLVAEAVYGPRTTIGANYQQWSTTTSLDGTNLGGCANTTSCYILFGVPPQQKALIVRHVSCGVGVSAGGLLSGGLLTRKGQAFPGRVTVLVPVHMTGVYRVVNSPVMHLVESGERPVVFLSNSTSSSWAVECSISGTLTQP